ELRVRRREATLGRRPGACFAETEPLGDDRRGALAGDGERAIEREWLGACNSSGNQQNEG
ncbi:MAG: hypothetical protein NDJ92_07235, partial [Thermoanaerobaculia bacterium]|nr:hypothetical protein [Thermoanaerobaculia bacterium]